MKKVKLPLSLRMVQGAIGKKFVIKHYSYGIVRTRFPEMKHIIASTSQRCCRNAFKEAVLFAQQVIADPCRKAEWEQQLRVKRRLFNALIRYRLQSVAAQKEQALIVTNRQIRKCFHSLSSVYYTTLKFGVRYCAFDKDAQCFEINERHFSLHDAPD